MPLLSLPTREPGNVSATGIGGPKNNARPLIEALRHEKIPADELNRLLDYVCSIAFEVGLTDGTTPGSLRQAVAAASGIVFQDTTGSVVIGASTSILRMTLLSSTTTLTAPTIGGGKSLVLLLADNSTEEVIFSAPGTAVNGGGFALSLPGSATGQRRAWFLYGRGTEWTAISYATYAELVAAMVRPAERIVGNALQGDTLLECDFLDPGDGTGILAACASLYGQPGSIVVRRGLYTFTADAEPITLASALHLRGEGRGATRIRVRAGSATAFPWLGCVLSGGDAQISDLTFEVPARAGATPAITLPLGVISITVPGVNVRRVDVDLIDDIDACAQPLAAIAFADANAVGSQVIEDVTLACNGVFITGHASNPIALTGIACGSVTAPPQLASALAGTYTDPVISRFRVTGGINDDAATPPYFTYGMTATAHSQFRLDDCTFDDCYIGFYGVWTSAAVGHFARGPSITNLHTRGAPGMAAGATFSGVTIQITQTGGSLFFDRIHIDGADMDGGTSGSLIVGVKVSSTAARLCGLDISNVHAVARATSMDAVIQLALGSGGQSPRINGCTLDTAGAPSQAVIELDSASRARIIDCSTDLLELGVGCSNTIVTSNHIRDPAGYTDSGTGTSLGGGNIVG